MPEKQKRKLMAKCRAGNINPREGRTCKEAAYAIMQAQENKRKGKS